MASKTKKLINKKKSIDLNLTYEEARIVIHALDKLEDRLQEDWLSDWSDEVSILRERITDTYVNRYSR